MIFVHKKVFATMMTWIAATQIAQQPGEEKVDYDLRHQHITFI